MHEHLFWSVIYSIAITGAAGYGFGKLAGMKRR